LDSWKRFEIGKLFPNIIKPKVYHTRELKEDANGIPYVVRTKFNNGIKYRVKNENLELNPKGVITFGAENSTFFYQDEEFVSGRDIYYIDVSDKSKRVALFLVACLNFITDKYSYNYGLFPELLRKEYIMLPTKDGDNVDFEYMEKYIATIEESQQRKLEMLQAV